MSRFFHRASDLRLGDRHHPHARRRLSLAVAPCRFRNIRRSRRRRISVTATYPGASAETAQSTVGQVIEQQLSGLDHLLYFTSQSGKDGSVH